MPDPAGTPSQSWFGRLLARFGSQDAPSRPVFLVGCGRSGTTILGTVLGRHPQITYLNEPRDVWTKAYPETDIWSADAGARRGRMHLTAADTTPRQTRALRAAFAREVRRSGRPQLVEKLPINAFRLEFIQAAFPDARFLVLLRNGIEVARSIERECARGAWYGADDYKWRQLATYADARPDTRGLPARCRTPYERGLLEWRLSVAAALEFAAALPATCRLQVTYESLVEDPAGTIAVIERFIGVPEDAGVHAFAVKEIGRRSPEAAAGTIPAGTPDLAGPLLDRLGYAVQS